MDVTVYVPFNLDFDQEAYRASFETLPAGRRSADYLYYICGTLASLQARYGGYNEERNGFTPLCSIYLRIIHFQYHKLIDYLLQMKVLETDGIYVEGEKCTGYRFSSAYRGQPLKEVAITELILKNNIREWKDRLAANHYVEVRRYMHIVKWYLQHHLEIDKLRALEWIDQYYKQELEQNTNMVKGHDAAQEEEKILADKCSSMRLFVQQIEQSQYDITEFSVCKAGNRLHGMFTYRKKELRNFITYNGQKLVSIDIKNSQPYFSTLLLQPEFWQSKKIKTQRLQLWQVAPDIYEEMRKDGSIKEPYLSYQWVTVVEINDSQAL